MIFLETSFLVNFFLENVQNHNRALEIWENIKEKEKVISEMVIYETLTVFKKLKQDNDNIANAYNKLTEMIIYEDIPYYEKALEYTLTNNIGFFDNLSYIVMINNDIKEIVSFDDDFDIFNNIKRIH
jgi:predicted nucleic acid-binding protein